MNIVYAHDMGLLLYRIVTTTDKNPEVYQLWRLGLEYIGIFAVFMTGKLLGRKTKIEDKNGKLKKE